MNYRLEDISPDDFEELVNELCQRILGTGMVSFSSGRDGGRDGRFSGTANKFPSETEKWSGRFIIQSKHTEDYQASCSDKTFHGNKTSIVNKEIERLKKLIKDEVIDNYIIFTNRKETGSREDAIKYIKKETKIRNVDIIGKATLHSWLSQNRDIVKRFGLDKFTMPIEFYDKDIRNVIVIFHDTLPKLSKERDLVLKRPNIETKNKINNLDKEYFEYVLKSDLNRYRNQILNFLENPINVEFAQYYEDTVLELKRVIETHRENFDNFKLVFDFLTKYLMDKEPEKLKKYRNTIPAFFHFMYYQCDIGREI
ncbi:MAG: ABC-three component system protein [Saprospiraceae bacterium]